MSELERFTGGHAIGVDVSGIERDLAALWRKASTHDASVTRACSWNLVAHATSAGELERVRFLADALVEAVPTRTLYLSYRASEPGPEIEASVTANCRKLPGGGKTVCTEEISIEARGKGADHLPSLLRALLVPDLPTALLWAGLPPTGHTTTELVPGVDRVVLDSAAADEREGLGRILQLALGKRGPALVDLNWLRLSPLRSVLASAFDPPVDAGIAFRLAKIRLAVAPRAFPAARLLIGWLASRLGLGNPEAIPGRGWSLERQGGRVIVELETAETALSCGVASVAFESERGEVVCVALTGTGLDVKGPNTCFQTSAHERSDGELIVAALGAQGVDSLYDAALRRAAELERA